MVAFSNNVTTSKCTIGRGRCSCC